MVIAPSCWRRSVEDLVEVAGDGDRAELLEVMVEDLVEVGRGGRRRLRNRG
jgi:hypothetical protein